MEAREEMGREVRFVIHSPREALLKDFQVGGRVNWREESLL